MSFDQFLIIFFHTQTPTVKGSKETLSSPSDWDIQPPASFMDQVFLQEQMHSITDN